MKIRCSRCGCHRFYYTLSNYEKVDTPQHHGACCAQCCKPIKLSDLILPFASYENSEKSYAE